MSLNKVMLIGRLGRDPELKYTSGGKAVANFSVATDSGKGANGEKRTEWHKITAWEKLAETCQKYLKKGSLVYIEGKIETRQWEKDGQKKSSTEIVCKEMRMLGDKPEAESVEARAVKKSVPAFVASDEDVPF